MDLPVFFKQMALRTGAILIVKIIGFLARIPLYRLLGAEGIGLYQMAYSVYGLILTILLGGFPTALAITTSKNVKQGSYLFQRLSIVCVAVSACMSFAVFLFSGDIATLLGDPSLDFSIKCLAPAILIVPVLTLLRGFLQGVEYYTSIAISELIEQVVRISVMLVLVSLWITNGIGFAVGGATLGAFSGAVAAFFFLLGVLLLNAPNHTNHSLEQSGRFLDLDAPMLVFLHTSLAIAGTRFILPFSEFLDALIVPGRLQAAGMTVSQATSIFGEMTGMAATVAYIPTIITAALTHTLTAKITSDWQKKDFVRFFFRTKTALEIGWFWGIGSVVFLLFYATNLSVILFGNEIAARGIRLLCLAPLIGGLRDISTSILWVMGKKKTPFIGLAVGIGASVILNYYLVAIPGFAYIGTAMGLLSIDFAASVYNLFILFSSRKLAFRYTLLLETASFVGMVIIAFTFIGGLLQIHWSPIVNSMLKMAFAYGIISLYLFLRYLKTTRLSIHIW